VSHEAFRYQTPCRVRLTRHPSSRALPASALDHDAHCAYECRADAKPCSRRLAPFAKEKLRREPELILTSLPAQDCPAVS
jgi:hypothetical protein